MNASLLVEILTEELPPKALRALGYSFADALVDELQNEGFVPPDPSFTSTPRLVGLAYWSAMSRKAPDREVLQGPFGKGGSRCRRDAIAALLGFAKKQGVGGRIS